MVRPTFERHPILWRVAVLWTSPSQQVSDRVRIFLYYSVSPEADSDELEARRGQRFSLCDPQALGDRLIGSDDAGVDKLDRNGRPHNRPVPSKVFQVRVRDGTYTQTQGTLGWLSPKCDFRTCRNKFELFSSREWLRSDHEHHAKRDPSAPIIR